MAHETPFIHKYLPLDLLEAHLERSSDAPRPIALIDIDSTILDTGARNIAILNEAAEGIPQLHEVLYHFTPENLGWNVPDVVAERAALKEDERQALWSFWRDRFFINEYLHYDEPYPGVAAFLQMLVDAGLHLIYLTGRDKPNMAKGTIESFHRYDLPFGSEDDFVFKPRQNEADLVFKERALSEVADRGEVILALENEPANANRMQRRFHKALVLLIETITTPNPELPDPRILRFRQYPFPEVGVIS